MLINEILLTESFKNLFTPKEKEQWADKVWDILQMSYKSIGGIKGSGFTDTEDMIKNIPMWKLAVDTNGDILALILYKDIGGRKSVATGTNGSAKGKAKLLDMIKNDFDRSMGEKSGPLLRFIEKNLPGIIDKYAIPADQVEAIIKKPIKIIDKYKYTREIGGDHVEKMLLGTPGKPII